MNINNELLTEWMDQTLDRAWHGVASGENPFAASVYSSNYEQISCEYNTAEGTQHPTRHGEVNAIDRACQIIGNRDLSGHILVSTAEPCPMCTAAALIAGVQTIVFGASQEVVAIAGFGGLGIGCDKLVRMSESNVKVIGGVRSEACDKLLMENCKSVDNSRRRTPLGAERPW